MKKEIISWITTVSTLAMLVLLYGCGKAPVTSTEAVNESLSPVGEIDPEGVVVRARALFTVESAPESVTAKILSPFFMQSAWAANQAVVVSNAPNTSMTLNNAQWSVPTITNALLDFGNLSISALLDNNLKVCGAGGNQKCNTALLRVYTSGVNGAGIWSEAEQYGAPLAVSHTAGSVSDATVGLSASNSVVLQTVSIGSNKRTIRLSDFNPAPNYAFKADFTDAGTGAYQTTIVIEYGLSL